MEDENQADDVHTGGMRDIRSKTPTLRTAEAAAKLRVGTSGMEALREDTVPKGDPYTITETAVLLAVKKTPDLIPHCHPVRIEHTDVTFDLHEDGITVRVTVSASDKTGMEMEALQGASSGALTLYDLLKPVENDLTIERVRLVSKSGGSSDFEDTFEIKDLRAAVLVTSDGTHAGKREDRSGKLLKRVLSEEGFTVEDYTVLPDERDRIRDYLETRSDDGMDFIATTGGTGPGPRDVTVEATRAVLDREIPGIAEAMRDHGQDRTPYAMFSRGASGQRGKTLIVNFPGSSNGTREGLDAIFPGLKHFFKMRGKHSGGH